jgi:predicted nucleic acid-binding protein
MSAPVTIDASVFVSAFSPTELGSQKSLEFIQRMKQEVIPVIVPTLLLPEIAAAIARKHGNVALALSLAEEMGALPNLTLIAVDESLARLAAETAATYKLRGSDAVYAAVSRRFATRLVTLDREQLERLGPVVTVNTP